MATATQRVTGMDIFAANYVRQSSARESGSEASTATQHAENRRALARYEPVKITDYEDLDRSAYKDDVTRKGYDRLIADCRAGRINMICVFYISRLTRADPRESLPLLLELLRLGVTIISVNEGVFRSDDDNSVITMISLIMRLDAAYRESKNKSEHIRAAKALVRSLGGYSGGNAPFGFNLVKEIRINPADGRPVQVQVPVHNDAQAAIIRDAWQRIKTHMATPVKEREAHPGSLSGVCIQFNREHVPTQGQTRGKKRANAQWRADVLRRILVHPWVAGYACTVIYGQRPDGTRSTKIAGYEITRDPVTTEPVRVCDPILDPAEWWQLQAWLGTRGRGRGRATHRSCLSGLRTPDGRPIITCECGRPMNACNTKGGRSTPDYRCTRPRGADFPGQHTGGNAIKQAWLDDYVAGRIFSLISAGEDDPEVADVLYEAARRYHAVRETPAALGERQALLGERADAVETLRGIAAAFGRAKSAIMRDSLMTQESTAAERLGAVERRLAELDDTAVTPLPISAWLSFDNGSDPLAPGSWWSTTSVEDRREWLALFLDNVTVTKASQRGFKGPGYDVGQRVRVSFAHQRGE